MSKKLHRHLYNMLNMFVIGDKTYNLNFNTLHEDLVNFEPVDGDIEAIKQAHEIAGELKVERITRGEDQMMQTIDTLLQSNEK